METEENSSAKNITDQVIGSIAELKTTEQLKNKNDNLDQHHEVDKNNIQHVQQMSTQESAFENPTKVVDSINVPLSFEKTEDEHTHSAEINNTSSICSKKEEIITNDASCASMETDAIVNQATDDMQTDKDEVNSVIINATEEKAVEKVTPNDASCTSIVSDTIPNQETDDMQTDKDEVNSVGLNSTVEKVVEKITTDDASCTSMETDAIVNQATDDMQTDKEEVNSVIINATEVKAVEKVVNDASCTSIVSDTIPNQETDNMQTDKEEVNSVTINATEEKVVDTNFKDDNSTIKDTLEDHSMTPLISKCMTLTSTLPTQLVDNASPKVNKENTSLSLLAEYASDESDEDNSEEVGTTSVESDTESVVEVPVSSSNNYRNQVFEIDSDNNSSSSESEDSDDNYLTKIRKTIEETIKTETDDEEDECIKGSNENKRPQLKVRGELMLEDLPPIQDLHITVPEEECIELGEVRSIVDQLILVSVLPNSILVDLDTVLFLKKGKKVLGEVFDVLGQVADPLYCVRFNSNKQIQEKEIKIGEKVYVAPKTKYTQFVVLANLIGVRGSDASWENDIEPPPHYLDYSDDDEERESRVKLRNKDRPNDHNDLKKRTRTNNDAPSTSARAAPLTNYKTKQNERRNMRGGYGNYSDNRSPQSPSQSPHRHQNNYNSGSWHSNYYPPAYYQQPNSPQYPVPPQYSPYTNNTMPPPTPYFNAFPQQQMPHHMQQQYPPPMRHQYPSRSASSMPNPMQHQAPMPQPSMQQPPMQQPIQTPPPTYVVNPFAIRPSVLSGNKTQNYQEPPPPGSSSNTQYK